MKKRVLSLLIVLVMALGMAANFAATSEEANIPAISTMSDMQTMSAETLMAFKGKFTDFFPDENFARVVAQAFYKTSNDQITLFELISLENLYLSCQMESISLEGIGYLMGLKSLRIFSSGEVVFPDDIENCGNLETLYAFGFRSNWNEAIIDSGVKELRLGGYFNFFDSLPLSFLEKAIRANVSLKFAGDSCIGVEQPIEYIKGTAVDVQGWIHPSALKIMEQATTINAEGQELTGATLEEKLLASHELSFDILNRIPNVGGMIIFIVDGEWTQLEFDIVDPPIVKTISETITTMDGRYSVSINGEIKGYFADGVSTLNAATISTQPLTITVTELATGTVQTYGAELLSTLSVTVTNGAIQSVTMFAMVNGSPMLYVG